MNKLRVITLLVVIMVLAVSQAQAATCYCKGKLFIGGSCGSFGIGGNPGDMTYNLTDATVKQHYLNTSIFAFGDYANGRRGWDWLTGWVCWK